VKPETFPWSQFDLVIYEKVSNRVQHTHESFCGAFVIGLYIYEKLSICIHICRLQQAWPGVVSETGAVRQSDLSPDPMSSLASISESNRSENVNTPAWSISRALELRSVDEVAIASGCNSSFDRNLRFAHRGACVATHGQGVDDVRKWPGELHVLIIEWVN
jgi:hypothetical protein